MTKKLSPLARIVAGAIRAADKGRPDIPTWEELRDRVDSATNGDLDCQQLDILTDMVEARLRRIAEAQEAAAADYYDAVRSWGP